MNSYFWKAALVAAALLAAPAPGFSQVNLVLTTMSPPGSNFSAKFFRPWADRVNQEAKGSIRVEPRDGGALANFGNVYDRIQNDVVQIGWGMQGLVAGKFPLSEVAALPFEADSAEQGSVALWRLYKSGLLGAEYKDIVPLALGTYAPNGIHYAKQPASLADFGGLKIRAASKLQSQWVEQLGGTPISLPPEDLYTALQRGTVDAVLLAWSTFDVIKLQEVTTYHVDAALGTSTIMIFMSKRKYNALPEAARTVIDANSGEALSRAWGRFCDSESAAMRKVVLASGNQTAVRLTPEQAHAWKERLAPVTQDWAKSRTGGEAVLAKYRSLIAEVTAGQ